MSTGRDDAKFARIENRLQNEEELDRLLEARCNDFTRDELVTRLMAADVLTAPVNEVQEVLDDPQIRHNRMIVSTEHAKLGPVQVTGVPIHFHGTPGAVRLPPPVHGQHTRGDLGPRLARVRRDRTRAAGLRWRGGSRRVR